MLYVAETLSGQLEQTYSTQSISLFAPAGNRAVEDVASGRAHARFVEHWVGTRLFNIGYNCGSSNFGFHFRSINAWLTNYGPVSYIPYVRLPPKVSSILSLIRSELHTLSGIRRQS